MAFKRDDYMTVKEIAALWGFSNATATRWINKYADQSAVEVYGGAYLVHKDEVLRWKAAYDGEYPSVKLAQTPFGKLRQLVASRRRVPA